MFCTGSLLAFVGRRLLVARSPNPFGPTARAAVAFALLWWVAVQWMVWNAPDWMLGYFMPAASVPLGFTNVLFLVACLLSAFAGHTLTALYLQRGGVLKAFLVLLSGGFVLFGLWGVVLDRYLHVGTAEAYAAGTAPLLTESHIAQATNVSGVILALGFGTLAAFLYRASRRLRAS